MEWERLADLTVARFGHSSCFVNGLGLVTVGGRSGVDIGASRWPPVAALRAANPFNTAFLLNSVECLATLDAAAATAMSNLNIDFFGNGAMFEDREKPGSVVLMGGLVQVIDPTPPGLLFTETSACYSADVLTGVCTARAPLGLRRAFFTAVEWLPGTQGLPAGGGYFVVSDGTPHSFRTEGEDTAGRQGVGRVSEGLETLLPDLLIERSFSRAHLLDGGRLMVIGGSSQFHPASLMSCETLNVKDVNGQWQQGHHLLQDMPSRRADFASAQLNGCVIVAGGLRMNTVMSKGVQLFHVASNTWRYLPPLPEEIFGMASSVF